MATITIRDLPETAEQHLRRRAAIHRRTPEEEARELLQAALEARETGEEWYKGLRAIVEPLGGIELEIPPRTMDHRPPPTFE